MTSCLGQYKMAPAAGQVQERGRFGRRLSVSVEAAVEGDLKAYEHDTDKSQLYLNNYARHFACFAGKEIGLLELGIDKGGSLLMWRDYFAKGTIAGLDVNHVEINDPSGRIRVYQGDQRDRLLLDAIAAECAPEGFDIIIDDASHIGEFTKASFWHLFDRHLKPGGLYVIEDWRVGYWGAWPDGRSYRKPSSGKGILRSLFMRPALKFPSHSCGMVGLIKQLMDELGMDAITNPARKGPGPQRFPKFQRMEVCPGQVFIVKATEAFHDLVAAQWRGAQ